ncbi:NUDIX domain-containing protein [Flavobacterium selenitireducens]|uniref:NUDIX domain-containing protein n=1 Tax=Flavobacterium selenitireducens TaxID=2722704 RepID=UPI00168B18F7|nr:NUDIX domain-containing protein [Flavobacterium selenitireducens]MBD3583637.1 NUDIX domain-containing protein [Flavobacterium selenitireducens]
MRKPDIRIVDKTLLSDNHYLLHKFTYEYADGEMTERHQREVYDRGNGAAVLLYNKDYGNVVLIAQFRLPTYLNGNPTGMMIEACAGLVEEDDPAGTVIREAIEETGYHIEKVEKAFSAYMSPGAVTEILHCYVAEYTKEMKLSQGGGLASENENIQVLEMPFEKALQMVKDSEITDAKTIMLLQYAQINRLLG